MRPANDLVETNFHAHQSNVLQVADTTYAPFLFWLVLDAYGRGIAGTAMEHDLKAPFVIDATNMTIEQREPANDAM